MRVSERSRHVRLVMRHEGLEVVVPRGFDRGRLPRLLGEKRQWIERASREMEKRRQRLVSEPPRLPTRIELLAIGDAWEVVYRAPRTSPHAMRGAPAGAQVREHAGQTLVVTGDKSDFEDCREAICRWLSRRARKELTARLADLSREHGLNFGKVSIRQQRTRWGSCSRRGNISLNARLLLMPPEAVDYVLLHELCHTRRMDHSPVFWELLESCDPNYRSHKRLVRESAKALPTWLDHEPQGCDM